MRKIIHIDMDAFYASVEQRDNKSLRGKPVVVAGNHERGVVAAASYEARRFGIKSAMSSVKAKELCPELIFVAPRLDYYKTISSAILNIFHRYTDIIEPLSLDEAFLDVTENKKGIVSAQAVAAEIRQAIKSELQLNASAGVSYNKFLAKIASDVNKPNGMFVVPPSEGVRFIQSLPVEQFFGVGKVTATKLKLFGLNTGADIVTKDKLWLHEHFGKLGSFLFSIVRGIDERPVQPHRKAHSVAAEHTFAEDITGLKAVFEKLEAVFNEALNRLRKKSKIPKTITLKIKYDDFSVTTKSKTMAQPNDDGAILKEALLGLCELDLFLNKKIRLLGVSFSNFRDESDSAQLQMKL